MYDVHIFVVLTLYGRPYSHRTEVVNVELLLDLVSKYYTFERK